MGDIVQKKNFHGELRENIDEFVHLAYKLTRKFPKEEIFGSASQLRRAALSVMLNYVEGYSRMRGKVHRNFLEISYGSLKESKYLIEFSRVEGFINLEEYKEALSLAEKIGAMLWGILKRI